MDFADIITLQGFEPSKFRLARHGFKEIDPLETFRTNPDRIMAYQAFQTKDRLGDAEFIASFAPHHGTQAVLLKVFRIDGKYSQEDAPQAMKDLVRDVAEEFGWWATDEFLKTNTFYDLTEVIEFNEYSERLVIEWGGAVTAWVQKLTNKPVVAIFPPGSAREFESFEKTVLPFSELKRIVRNPNSNRSWVQALKSVNGIYVITNTRDGRNYVGSAYGKDGIWGRWCTYAETGHAGNKMLKDLPSMDHMQFSILEILSGTSTAIDAIEKENFWKLKLRSREGGYNSN